MAPPSMSGPAPWYILAMMGLQMLSSSFILSSNSSASASWFPSSHWMVLSIASSIFFLSSSTSLAPIFSSLTVRLVLSRDIQDTIGINVKAYINLRNTPRCRRNAREFEFAQQVLELLIPFTTQDGSLHSSTIGNGLIWVNAFAQLLAVEEVLQQLLDLGNPSGSSNEDNVMHATLVHLGIPQTLLHRLHTLPRQIYVQLLKTSTGSSQSSKSPWVSTNVLLVLSLELLDKVIHQSVVEILTTKMGVTSGGLHFKDTLLHGEQRYIKVPTTKIEDQHILLTNTSGLFVKTIRNRSSGWLVDDTHNIEAGNDSSIFGGLTLRIPAEVHSDTRSVNLHLS
ncbi:hypothetical protein Cgig2_026742 [Carnegiea gigantea]|uniref:Uncharacterized protein n=1 Tax=Carnegiea gigantea TaxID=171969 RepID=A0A9Q1Q7M2_9CARY|nr:hypothetical protein Cgig2_026742 [Carnegiea gigantea]